MSLKFANLFGVCFNITFLESCFAFIQSVMILGDGVVLGVEHSLGHAR